MLHPSAFLGNIQFINLGEIMSCITLHTEKNITYTNVPDLFIDKHMASANGEFVKIYVYLLRCLHLPGCDISISSIADFLNHTEADIMRALGYWEKQGLIRLERDKDGQLSGICFVSGSIDDGGFDEVQSPSSFLSGAGSDTHLSLNTPSEIDVHKDYSADELKAFSMDSQVKEIFYIAEMYLCRTLSPTDMQKLLYIYDGLGFETDLLEYLIEHCVSSGHASIRYIERTAIEWHKQGIRDKESAKLVSRSFSKSHSAVMKAFGIRCRNLAQGEIQLVDKWNRSYGFSPELISEACNRTMRAIHQPSFEYADKILDNWKSNKVTSLEDIIQLDTKHRQGDAARKNMRMTGIGQTPIAARNSSFHNFQQRSYDFDKLQKQLVLQQSGGNKSHE